jgi:hypothetical protein
MEKAVPNKIYSRKVHRWKPAPGQERGGRDLDSFLHRGGLDMALRISALQPHWWLVACLLAMPGCATYTDLPDAGKPDAAAVQEMPQLAVALNTVDLTRKDFQSRRNQLDISHQVFNQAVFFLAGGAAAALIFDAPRLVALGLGTGAGAMYSYGALFYPATRPALYNAGVQALSCVYDKGAPTLKAFSTFKAQEQRGIDARSICGSSDACITSGSDFDAAVARANALFKADGAASGAVRQATQNVILEVNRQAEASVPDIGRVFQAATGISNISQAFVPPEKEKKEKAAALALEENPQALATLRSSTDEINSAVTLAMNKLDSLSTPCAIDVAANAPLTIDANNQKITFTAPGTQEFSVTGGTQPLTVGWNGSQPDKDVIDFTYLPPRTIRLVAKKIVGGPYNLLISDSKAAVNVEITMSKPSS